MPGEVVADASVIAKFFFFENGSEVARSLLTSGLFVSAPDLILVEMASIASKKVRRGLSHDQLARVAIEGLGEIIDLFAPLKSLSIRAFSLAREHGFSAYDGAYLALAEERGVQLLTADDKLARRAHATGLGHLVCGLTSV
jgi:predicted nucleic acid-binding protein